MEHEAQVSWFWGSLPSPSLRMEEKQPHGERLSRLAQAPLLSSSLPRHPWWSSVPDIRAYTGCRLLLSELLYQCRQLSGLLSVVLGDPDFNERLS